MGKQIFISHTWMEDEEGRDTHQRAKALSEQLTHRGWTTWLDEYDMRNNIDSSMATGIDESDIVLLLLTRKYARKINRGARSAVASNDNCLKEFAYALFRMKDVVPVVFERCMLNPACWSPGVVPMRLSMTLYVDGTGEASESADAISRLLRLKGHNPRRLDRTIGILPRGAHMTLVRRPSRRTVIHL